MSEVPLRIRSLTEQVIERFDAVTNHDDIDG
jgi:hypothetical protein